MMEGMGLRTAAHRTIEQQAASTLNECVYKANINGDRIECGKCGALLAKLTSIHTDKESCKLEIKCKHKQTGMTCNCINRIEL